MKQEIIKTAERLIWLLENCDDNNFVEEVICAISNNDFLPGIDEEN